MLHFRISSGVKSSCENMEEYISTLGCLFWLSTGNIQNSVDLYYDLRKYVVISTMSQSTSK